jgi:hypothetical protein
MLLTAKIWQSGLEESRLGHVRLESIAYCNDGWQILGR